MVPQYRPRGVVSNSAMIPVVPIFGAPVIDAHGKGKALDVAEPGDGNGADVGYPADVVSNHVHDHEILGAVLLRLPQAPRRLLVVPGRSAAGRRAFHRPGFEDLVLKPEEQLGGRAAHRPPAHVDVGCVPGTGASRQPQEVTPGAASNPRAAS